MSSSRLLDFFILEATDYIDRLDSMLLAAGEARPDPEGFTAQARLLRGSATMARQLPIADLASAVERISRAVRDGILEWNQEMHAALVAAVDDLKILIRAVRNWGAGDDRRTESRISELVSLYPQANKARPTPPANLRNASFIASESAQLATALDALVAHPSNSETLAVASHRLSSLRGVATINDTPPLPHVLAALDDILRPLVARGAVIETQHLAVLTSAVHLLRRFSQEIAIGGMMDVNAPVVHDFNAALGGLSPHESATDGTVIPISRLNFEDGLPQLVSAGSQAPSSAAQRFRLEATGPCELLRHQVALARNATDDMRRKRAVDEMRASLRVLRSTADGFELVDVVSYIDAIEPELNDFTPRAFSMIEEMSRAIVHEKFSVADLLARLRDSLDRPAEAPPVHRPSGEVAVAPAAPPPRASGSHAAAPSPPPATVSGPQPVQRQHANLKGAELSTVLSAGISGLASLESKPLSDPVAVAEDQVVPIAHLLYRGKDAIARAKEIRDDIRARATEPQREELDEIFELLDLATTE